MNQTPTTISQAAVRMRNHRARRKEGRRAITIEVRQTEILELMKRGLLEQSGQRNADAIATAIHKHLDATLSE